jgi:hypothetical protein
MEKILANLLGKYFRFLRSILKIALPVALIACIATPIYGHFVHWASSDEALLHYEKETAVMVTGQYESRSTVVEEGMDSFVYRERAYVLLPSMFRDPKLVIVSQRDNEPYELTEERNGVFRVLAAYCVFAFGTCWFWLRRVRKP